jgi:aryl-alcohol dehydrogenase-like predicted oxidoreductase
MIERQPFGSTGHESSRIIFGAYALKDVTEDEASEILALLQQYGVNQIDTAAKWYGDSELHVGRWMERHRDDFFLATKMAERTYESGWDQFRRSLARLHVDYVDLLQLHNLVDEDDWATAMGDDGALKVAIEAREQGLTRFIGVTGHGLAAPRMHLRSLERFDFDAVLAPYNYVLMQNVDYARDFDELVSVCQARGVAVQTIKAVAHRMWGDEPHSHLTWYKPLEDPAAIAASVQWVLGRPGVFLNSVGSPPLLPHVLEAAAGFESRPSDAEMERVVAAQEIETIFPADGG